MQAIILAGGKGTRLKPYTITIPKPLVPIGESPILEIVIKQLKKNGFDRITLALGHQAELLQAYFQNGERYGVDIQYSLEEQPLGTAGPIKLIDDLDDNFLVLNSDDLTDLSYRNLFDFHVNENAMVSIGMFTRDLQIDLGIIESNENNTVTGYIEKPKHQFNVSMGIYAFNKNAVEYIPQNQRFDFPDLIRTLLKNQKKVLSYHHKGFWLDIGRPEDYEKAHEEFGERKSQILGD
jgi:NDP-sugar pyrophosphorylase family protein